MNAIPSPATPLDAQSLQALLYRSLPLRDLHALTVESCEGGEVRLRFPFDASLVGPGDIFSGPALLSFADTSIYAAAQTAYGDRALALTSSINATFLRPAQAADILALSRVVKRGRQLAHVEAWLFNHVAIDAVLHATATCTIASVGG
jgi:uncharacterized protein (TIGR00369 family)